MGFMDILTILVSLIAGGIIGAFIMFRLNKKQIEKNPPINEKMIRAMYMSMGRKPSEAQIRQTMNAVKQNEPKKKK